MNNNINSKKVYAILGLVLTTTVGFLVSINDYDSVMGQQPTSEIDIGNTTGISIGDTTSESSDTFFQLDNSIQTAKSLVNETQLSVDSGNTTEVHDLLNQIYNELLHVSNYSNNLIWDTSNEGN
jgi:hypothetical protein